MCSGQRNKHYMVIVKSLQLNVISFLIPKGRRLGYFLLYLEECFKLFIQITGNVPINVYPN